MRTTTLGKNGPSVSALGLGCMAMSDAYGPADETVSIATIHAALDHGITLIDTGDFYGMGHNEMLIGRALRDRRDQAFLSVKFGAMRGPDGSFIGLDFRPQAVKNSLAYSLRRLGTDYIDLYRPARVDPSVPVEETIGAIADLIKAGYVRHIGLSEAGAQTLRKAAAVHTIADLQIEYALITRGMEDTILPTARELGISITAYGVLSRGLLSGAKPEGAGDFRTHQPRFEAGNFEKNQRLVDALGAIAASKGLSTAQLAVAWAGSRGADIIPVVGARKPERIHEAIRAVEVRLTPEDLSAVDAAVKANPVAGDRYDASQMAWLDSEKVSA